MLKMVVCVSGGGTNLQAIIDSIKAGTIQNTEIVKVISNNKSAYGLERASKAGILTEAISPKDYTTRELFNEALLNAINSEKPDVIILAGFLVNIPLSMIETYRNRIINVHPSLIPSFCGTGYYGMKVHEKAIERGVKLTGATVHIVDEGTDTGPILMQKAVAVLDGDTPEILQKRVMEEAEWIILPKVINELAMGNIQIG